MTAVSASATSPREHDRSQSRPHTTARQGRIRRVYAGVVASYIHDISRRTVSI
jgi:hypothetical protein